MRCKNCDCSKACRYTGKEDTPRGLGWCAAHEEEGKKRKGRNGQKYVVKGVRWVRVSSRKKKTSPRMYLNTGDIKKLQLCGDITYNYDNATINNAFEIARRYKDQSRVNLEPEDIDRICSLARHTQTQHKMDNVVKLIRLKGEDSVANPQEILDHVYKVAEKPEFNVDIPLDEGDLRERLNMVMWEEEEYDRGLGWPEIDEGL